ncbi:MAG: DUF932 domain-containing protein [Candidatus Aenigmarchaeota archaeon]|nr:DUF932 domain-containing protein [Candidatus Aenigmarchaeota archaeon]
MRTTTELNTENLETNPIYGTKHLGKYHYNHANTSKIIETIQDKFGLEVISTSIVKPRKKEKLGYQKHLVTMSADFLKIDDQNKVTLIIENSHDCKSSLKFRLGIYRLVCANGLITGKTFLSKRIIHTTPNFYNEIETSINQLLNQTTKLKDLIKKGLNKDITKYQIKELMNKAIKQRYNLKDNEFQVDYRSYPFLREEDKNLNVYDQFNRIQEAVIRGGGKYLLFNKETEKWELKTIRRLKSIDKQVDLNQKLFNEFELLVA